jgi:uncharacterized protein (DUF2147 family)
LPVERFDHDGDLSFGERTMRTRYFMVAAALLALAGTGHAVGNEPSAAGLWQSVDDDTHKPTGWFLIRDNGGVYDGAIVRMFLKPGENPDAVCDQCTDDRHNKPWLGLDIIRGMKRNGTKYTDGTILDPRNGRVYSAEMSVTPDGQTLVVRGYLGISLLGQNQYWTRLPDTAYNEIDPRFNPNAPPASAHKPQTTPKPKS